MAKYGEHRYILRKERNAYANAIDKVREEHRLTIAARNITLECPKCGTKQVVPDTPGMRTCLKCGYEFRLPNQRTQSY